MSAGAAAPPPVGRSSGGEPGTVNLVLAALHVLANAFQFFVLPLFLLPLGAGWALFLVPLALLNNALWSLAHDTIHGTFHPAPGINRLAGRLLAICYGAPWRVVRVGHLLHHRLNRTPLDRAEAYDAARTSWLRAAVGYYFQLFGGLYVSQILSPCAFFLPRRVLEALRRKLLSGEGAAALAAAQLLRPVATAELRVDGAAIAVMFAASAYCYAGYWPLLLAAIGARAVCISFLDYVYHYGSRTDRVLHGFNLRLPRPFALLLLNFNLHGVHHRHPGLGWRQLPDAFAAAGGRFDGGYGAAALRQLRGPIAQSALRAGEGGGQA